MTETAPLWVRVRTHLDAARNYSNRPDGPARQGAIRRRRRAVRAARKANR